MENNWERTIPYLELNKEQIQVLFNGILKAEDIEYISKIDEGCRTTNYKIDSKIKDSFILKVFFDNNESYRREIKLFNKLKKEIKVPEICKFDNHEIIENREFIIYRRLNGQSLSNYIREGNIIEEKFVRQVAKAMASIHKNKYDKVGFLDDNLQIKSLAPPLCEWYRMFMGKNAQIRLGEKIKNEVYKIADENKDILRALDNDPRMVHGDFQGTNILIDDDGNLSGILDWEFCMAGHPLADIGQFFRYDEYFDSNLINAFEDEYKKQSDYILPNNWYEISKIRDITNLLQLIDKEEDMPNKYFDIKEKMKKILEFYNKNNCRNFDIN